EAMVAKRRGRAVLISHNTPAFAPAGLHGDLLIIHELLHQLGSMQEGRVFENTRDQLWARLEASGLHLDLELAHEDLLSDWNSSYVRVHDYLEALAGAAQPLGLHVFGEPAEGPHLVSTILQILGPQYLLALDPDEGEHAMTLDYEQLQTSNSYQVLKSFLIDGAPLADFPETVHPSLTQARQLWDRF